MSPGNTRPATNLRELLENTGARRYRWLDPEGTPERRVEVLVDGDLWLRFGMDDAWGYFAPQARQ